FLGEFKMSKKRSRRRFTKEFKAETVKLVKQSDRTMSAIAMELGISAKSVGEWVRNAAGSKESMSEPTVRRHVNPKMKPELGGLFSRIN
ncbi:MAG TPA: hypothetical protein EYG46_02630, partial [Myxococcales bacterium]|nr:hypothetical protein [Myxococcales bacterium]